MDSSRVQNALERIAAGKPVVLLDDSESLASGHLILAGEDATEEWVNFMAVKAMGVMCVGVPATRVDELELGAMPGAQNNPACEGWTISVEAREGVTTGISAWDRSQTILVLANPESKPEDLVSPGHIFPIRVESGGVLHRARPGEASVELARLAGKSPVGVYCALLDSRGELLGDQDAQDFAVEHDLAFLRLSELIHYRMAKEFFVRRIAEMQLETNHGPFSVLIYENELDQSTHPVLVKGTLKEGSVPLLRIHSQCLTGDAFSSLRCDCGDQLDGAMRRIAEEGEGVIIYLRQEGRGIGLVNKVRAYNLQDSGKDTVDANLALGFGADQRSYVVAAQVMKDLGCADVRLITNNQRKIQEMEQWGINVVERVAMDVAIRPENENYLRTKRDRLGHLFEL